LRRPAPDYLGASEAQVRIEVSRLPAEPKGGRNAGPILDSGYRAFFQRDEQRLIGHGKDHPSPWNVRPWKTIKPLPGEVALSFKRADQQGIAIRDPRQGVSERPIEALKLVFGAHPSHIKFRSVGHDISHSYRRYRARRPPLPLVCSPMPDRAFSVKRNEIPVPGHVACRGTGGRSAVWRRIFYPPGADVADPMGLQVAEPTFVIYAC